MTPKQISSHHTEVATVEHNEINYTFIQMYNLG